MKPKISPDNYRSTLSLLELKALCLKDCEAKYKEDYLSQALKLDIKEKASYTQDDRNLFITYKYQLKAKDTEKDNPAVMLNAVYVVQYEKSQEVIVTDDFFEVFQDLTLGMLLWPYFREFTNNMIYRMNLPPLLLGLRKRL